MRAFVATTVALIMMLGVVVVATNDAAAQPALPSQCATGMPTVDMTIERATGAYTAWFQARQTCSGLTAAQKRYYVTGAMQCHISYSTMASDLVVQKNAVGRFGDWIVQGLAWNPLLADAAADLLGPDGGFWYSWTTTQVTLRVVSIARCAVHPEWAAYAGDTVKPKEAAASITGASFAATSCIDGTSGAWLGTYREDWRWGCFTQYSNSTQANSFVSGNVRACSFYSHAYSGSTYIAQVSSTTASGDGCPKAAASPGACCTLPGWGVDDPLPPWATGLLSGCEGLTVTSDDNSGEYFAEGDSVDFALEAIDAERPPNAQRVNVSLTNPGDPGDTFSTTLSFSGAAVPFTAPVPAHEELGPTEPRLLDYLTFVLRCDDGTVAYRYYDMSGSGGSYSTGGGGFDLDACMAASADPGLNPVTWIPALVERLQCLSSWLFTPSKPVGWYLSSWSIKGRESAVADVLEIGSAPWTAVRNAGNTASSTQTVSMVEGRAPAQLPPMPDDVRNMVSNTLGIGVFFGGLLLVARMLGRALGFDSVADGAGIDSGSKR